MTSARIVSYLCVLFSYDPFIFLYSTVYSVCVCVWLPSPFHSVAFNWFVGLQHQFVRLVAVSSFIPFVGSSYFRLSSVFYRWLRRRYRSHSHIMLMRWACCMCASTDRSMFQPNEKKKQKMFIARENGENEAEVGEYRNIDTCRVLMWWQWLMTLFDLFQFRVPNSERQRQRQRERTHQQQQK